MEIDAALIKKVKGNDRKVIMQLYEHTFNVLMGTAVRYYKNEEEQKTIVNNAFLKIIDNIDKYRVGTHYFSWAQQIVKNVVIDDFRKNKKYKSTFNYEADTNQNTENIAPETDYASEKEHLLKMLDQLPPATKLVFNLYAVDEFKNKEICDKLDLKYETVKWHIKEARKRLKKMLNQEEIQVKDE